MILPVTGFTKAIFTMFELKCLIFIFLLTMRGYSASDESNSELNEDVLIEVSPQCQVSTFQG